MTQHDIFGLEERHNRRKEARVNIWWEDKIKRSNEQRPTFGKCAFVTIMKHGREGQASPSIPWKGQASLVFTLNDNRPDINAGLQ